MRLCASHLDAAVVRSMLLCFGVVLHVVSRKVASDSKMSFCRLSHRLEKLGRDDMMMASISDASSDEHA